MALRHCLALHYVVCVGVIFQFRHICVFPLCVLPLESSSSRWSIQALFCTEQEKAIDVFLLISLQACLCQKSLSCLKLFLCASARIWIASKESHRISRYSQWWENPWIMLLVESTISRVFISQRSGRDPQAGPHQLTLSLDLTLKVPKRFFHTLLAEVTLDAVG